MSGLSCLLSDQLTPELVSGLTFILGWGGCTGPCQRRGGDIVGLPPPVTLNDFCPSPGLLASQNNALGDHRGNLPW